MNILALFVSLFFYTVLNVAPALAEKGHLPPPPEETYNQLVLDYIISGAVFDKKTYNDNWTRSYTYEGKLDSSFGGVLRVSGRAEWRSYPGPDKNFPWSVSVSVTAGQNTKNQVFSPKTKQQEFDVSVPIGNAQDGSFSIRVVRSSTAGERNIGASGVMKGRISSSSETVSNNQQPTPASRQDKLKVQLTCEDRLANQTDPNILTHAIPSGGQRPYRYQWFAGDRPKASTTPIVKWITKGTGIQRYRVVVTDASNATAQANCQVEVKGKKAKPGPAKTTTPCNLPADFESIYDVAPQTDMAGPLLDAGRYYIYIALAGKADAWRTWGWKRFGPFGLRAGTRYQVVHTGDLSQRPASTIPMSSGQTDVMFLNHSSNRIGFAVRPASCDAGTASKRRDGSFELSEVRDPVMEH